MSARRIVIMHQQGLTPEEITTDIPHLTLAQVYAVLAYYHANREAVDADIAAEEAEATRLEKEWLACQHGIPSTINCTAP